MKWKDLEPRTVWIQNMNRSVGASSRHQRALMCWVVAPWLSCPSKTWSVSLKPGEPASCPPLSTSPWRTWTCGSLLLKTAVSTASVVLFCITVIIIDSTVDNRVETVLNKYRSVFTEQKAMEHAACLLTSVRVCASVRSKRSVQPVRRVEPLGHHHGRSLHSLLSQPQLGRVVHVQWLQVGLNTPVWNCPLSHTEENWLISSLRAAFPNMLMQYANILYQASLEDCLLSASVALYS